jgi:hypothetical protein
MRKLALTLAAGALAFGVLISHAAAQQLNTPQMMSPRATAASEFSVLTIPTLKFASPATVAACNGHTGACGCGPGFVSACRHYCCHCRPC